MIVDPSSTTRAEHLREIGARSSRDVGAVDWDVVLNALPDPVVVVNGEDDLIYVNQAAEQFLSGSEASLIGTNLQNLIPHDSPALSLVRKVRKTVSSMSVHGVELSTPRIGTHTVSIDAAPVLDATAGDNRANDGAVVLVLKLQSIADKISGALTRQGASRSISALSAMLAHEVKNPLSGIRGAAQLLESLVSSEDRQLTRLITEETDRIVKLIDRMEVFSDRPVLDRQAVNIHEVLDRAIDVARKGFGSDIRIEAEYDPSLPHVYGDRDQLIQIFINLIKNATEAVEKDTGKVTVKTAFRHGVRLAVSGREARVDLPLLVSVEDNGSGVPEDIRPHLFDPFITTKSGGSGLGLALVGKLVSDHGGVVDISSKPGRTVFSVMLPMFRANDISGEASSHRTEPDGGETVA